jgi:Coenzyme PQQ synthesis protein D (PqqD)
MTDLATRITVPESVLFRDLDGEAVLLETVTSRYFGLDEVGTRMWSLLQLHGDSEAVCRALCTEYDVPEAKLREDLAQLIAALAARGLLKVAAADG